MASVYRRIPVSWTTGPGGSGVSIFYCGDTDDLTPGLGAFFNSIRAFCPTAVTFSIPASGDKINDTDGTLAGAWSGGTAATYTGLAASAFAAGTGMYVRWLTGSVVDGHKLQGRTFIVPIVTSSFFTDGELQGGTVSGVQTAATTLAATAKMILWHRPRKAYTSPDGTTHPDRIGTGRLVIAATVPNKVTSLRSRRS
jgi:hypothetical protein